MKTPEDILAHFGVKGMKWGVRRPRLAKMPPASADAERAHQLHQRVKQGGPKTLSNHELQTVINRMNLEQQFARLNPTTAQKGLKIVSDILSIGNTVNQTIAFANSPAGKAIRDGLAKKG